MPAVGTDALNLHRKTRRILEIGRGKRLHAAHGDIVADGIDERTAGTVLRRPVRKQARQLNGGLRGARQELGQRIDAAVFGGHLHFALRLAAALDFVVIAHTDRLVAADVRRIAADVVRIGDHAAAELDAADILAAVPVETRAHPDLGAAVGRVGRGRVFRHFTVGQAVGSRDALDRIGLLVQVERNDPQSGHIDRQVGFGCREIAGAVEVVGIAFGSVNRETSVLDIDAVHIHPVGKFGHLTPLLAGRVLGHAAAVEVAVDVLAQLGDGNDRPGFARVGRAGRDGDFGRAVRRIVAVFGAGHRYRAVAVIDDRTPVGIGHGRKGIHIGVDRNGSGLRILGHEGQRFGRGLHIGVGIDALLHDRDFQHRAVGCRDRKCRLTFVSRIFEEDEDNGVLINGSRAFAGDLFPDRGHPCGLDRTGPVQIPLRFRRERDDHILGRGGAADRDRRGIDADERRRRKQVIVGIGRITARKQHGCGKQRRRI